MKVLTLDNESFGTACVGLQKAVEDARFVPDMVLGIESGGRYVAEKVFTDVPHCYVTLRRPSTAAKTGLMRRLVRKLPRAVNDALRILESRMLMLRHAKPIAFSGTLPAAVTAATHILVVDDAVDSGVTMRSIQDAVKAYNPSACVECAAITVTTRRPLVTPKFHLYNCLIRFPWSADAQN